MGVRVSVRVGVRVSVHVSESSPPFPCEPTLVALQVCWPMPAHNPFSSPPPFFLLFGGGTKQRSCRDCLL